MSIFYKLKESAKNYLDKNKSTLKDFRAFGLHTAWRMQTGDTSQTIVTYPPMGAATEEAVPSRETEIKPSGFLTLYLHIPFCNSTCSYCAYARTVVHNRVSPIQAYLQAMSQEMDIWTARYQNQRIPVKSIYIGGGTPTVLSTNQLAYLFETIQAHFDLPSGGEYTLEANPSTSSAEKFALAKQFGVNRASIGVESFNPHLLKKMNRDPNLKIVFAAVDNIRKSGISHIDIDLIRGYPEQTPEDMVRDLEGMRQLGVPSVTSYQYALKPKSIDSRRFASKNLDPDNLLLLHQMFISGAERSGYRHQTPLVDWFIKSPKWTYQQQVQKWMEGIDLIGIGLGAYGNIGNVQYFNHDRQKNYTASLLNGRLPLMRALSLSQEEIMRRRVVLGVKGYIDRCAFQKDFGVDVLESPCGETLAQLVDIGALYKEPSRIGMTKMGLFVANAIQKRLFSPAVLAAKNRL